MTLEAVLALTESVGATQERRDATVFRLATAGMFKRTAPDLPARQTRLLAALLELDQPLYWSLEHPPSGFDSSVPWPEVSPGVWIAPAGFAAADLRRRWLYTGNWQAFAGESPTLEVPWIDPARSTPKAFVEFMRAAKLQLLLDSFHDDYEWRIGFHLSAG